MISVIVPVYNVELYLEKCIDSILDQSYFNFELILIDDGSTDRSPQICENYAQKDKRVRVVHTDNYGVSHARNSGLDIASGEYIVFCDSDDYVGVDYLSDLTFALFPNSIQNTLVLTNLSSFAPEGEIQTNLGENRMIDLDKGTIDDYMYLVERYAIYGPYCKLYSRDIVEKYHLRFNEMLRSAEDFDFNIRYLKHIRFVQTVKKSQYFYRVGYKQGESQFIDESAILSAHIMSEELACLAQRMNVYQESYGFLSYRTAEKHWLSRLPSIFVENQSIEIRERRIMYDKLRNNSDYRTLCKDGLSALSISRATKLMARIDSFIGWLCFFKIYHLLRKRTY